MSYWAGLYGSDMQNKIMDGVKLLLSCANRVLVQQQHPPLLIGPPPSHLEDDDTSTDEAWNRCEHSLLFVLLSSTPMLNWSVKNSTRGRFLGSLGPGQSVVGWYETWKSSHIHPALNLYRYPLSLPPPSISVVWTAGIFVLRNENGDVLASKKKLWGPLPCAKNRLYPILYIPFIYFL